jgi:hypothetical protein
MGNEAGQVGRCWRAFLGLALIAFGLASGCIEKVATIEPCIGLGCFCESDEACGSEAYCDGAQGICREQFCAEGDVRCENGNAMRCNERGTAFVLDAECGELACVGGRCQCNGDEHCSPGETCSDGACSCASGVSCGTTRVCCGEQESCREQEVCEEGRCFPVFSCLADCEGQRCGFGGELCCQGEAPVCSPSNTCIRDCGPERVVCGENLDVCCEAGELCIFGDCRAPGEPCERFTDCDFGQYCEHVVGRCLPDEFPEGIDCRGDGQFDELEPEVLWHWSGVELGEHRYEQVMMTPVVADLTGRGRPHVVFSAYRPTATTAAVLVVADGATGETLYTNATRPLDFGGQIALGDLDGDGRLEMAVSRNGGIGVVDDVESCPDPEADERGCYLWTFDLSGVGQGAPIIADLDADGRPEVIIGTNVFAGATGERLATVGRGDIYALVADLNGDGRLELYSNGCAYRYVDKEDGGRALEPMWCAEAFPSISRAYSAVGDVVGGERAGLAEIIVTGNSNVYVLASESGALVYTRPLPGGGLGGAPTVADFDGDGRAEFGIAGQGCYTVFDMTCMEEEGELPQTCQRPTIAPCTQGVDCFEVELCPALAGPDANFEAILWSVYIQDLSSSRTGSSVFDFQGDGRNEVVYNDECLLMVFDGQSGAPQFRFPNTNRTSSEYPVIVDVNGDGRTNIVVSANNDQFNRDCRNPIQARPDRYPECHGETLPNWCTEGTRGVIALQDPLDRWVRTRAIWNQYAYHIDNIGDDGSVPTRTTAFWRTHNTYRANRQGEVPLNSPDVVVSAFSVSTTECPPELTFSVTITNRGTRAIEAGLPVSLYRSNASGAVAIVTVPEAILPGASHALQIAYPVSSGDFNQPLGFEVVANDDGTGASVVEDCDPDSARAVLEGVVCRIFL